MGRCFSFNEQNDALYDRNRLVGSFANLNLDRNPRRCGSVVVTYGGHGPDSAVSKTFHSRPPSVCSNEREDLPTAKFQKNSWPKAERAGHNDRRDRASKGSNPVKCHARTHLAKGKLDSSQQQAKTKALSTRQAAKQPKQGRGQGCVKRKGRYMLKL